ncbi:IS1182 family transposase [Verrucomicrobiota bacterium]
MARFKKYSYAQGEFIPVCFEDQIVPGTFEYALNYIIDNELDLSVFKSRYNNDENGAPAFDPAILLKIILFAYSLGITSTRQIAKCCETNIVFMALSANSKPHFTTIASFVSSIDNEISSLFRDVLLICAEEQLIGKQMFAIDGCKLSSDCSKEWSGTRSDFEKKKEKIEKSIDFIVRKHKAQDKEDQNASLMIEKEKKALKNLRTKAKKIQNWLNDNEDRTGTRGQPIKSNITDNDSAKMKSSEHGMMQGYTGIAAVDDKHQVVVHAEAHGTASEQQTLPTTIDGIEENFNHIGEENVLQEVIITADTGFHSENNLEMLAEKNVKAYIADNKFRKRNPDFKTAQRHKKPVDRHHTVRKGKYFTTRDFHYDKKRQKMICPNGNEMVTRNSNFYTGDGLKGISYEGKKADCLTCKIRKKCLRNPGSNNPRQTTVFSNKTSDVKESYCSRMIKLFDSAIGRHHYSRRMGIAEPVFGNIRNNIGLDRFSLRGKQKVDAQWKLFCMVHNLGKISRYGYSHA